MRYFTLVAVAALAASALPATARQVVLNGGFEDTTLTGSSQISDYYAGNPVAHWTTSGYNFLYFPGTATTTGAANQYGGGNLTFYGPGNGTANGYVDSPTGGNYIANDGAYIVDSLRQTLTGLVVGRSVVVGFDWAAAQQTGFDGETTEQWVVGLGNDSQSTAVWNNADHGFKPWSHETFTFTATAATEVLSFLAVGTPDGRPPFSLLDGVTANASVPEPAAWALMLGGLGLVGGSLRSRRRTVAA